MEANKTQSEFFKYDGMIRKFYYQNQKIFNHPSLALDIEDVLQDMRILIFKAIPNYDPEKGASLSTYIYMHLKARLYDLRSKLFRRSKYHAGFVQDLTSNGHIDDQRDLDYSLDRFTYEFSNEDFSKQDVLADLIDVKLIIESLKASDQELFVDRYIYGYKYAELQERHNQSNTYLATKLTRIDKIFKTLRFQ